MSREAQVRFCERRGVRFPPPTLLVILCPTRERAEQARATLGDILAGLGLSLSAAKTSLVDLREPGRGFDFLGFHHRRVESFTRKGRFFCARWPSQRAVRAARDKIRGHTARRRLLLPAEYVVEGLNRFLAGWRGYFAYGNSTKVFHDLDQFVTERMARFVTKKHGRHGRDFGLMILRDHQNLGLIRLTGSIRHGPVHAVR